MAVPIKGKNIFIALFIVLSGAVLIYQYWSTRQSEEEIINSYKANTESAVNQLVVEAEREMMDVWERYIKGKDAITRAQERYADSLLSDKVEQVLLTFDRVEGGIYFFELDKFVGYSFPTIEEPKPAFGPPPRSYDIIRNQVRKTIKSDELITELHRFDPAIFPLSTKPIFEDGEIIGAAWARRHIERELEASQSFTGQTFFMTVGLILLGLFIALIVVTFLKNRLNDIKESLDLMKTDPSYRLPVRRGVFGFISRSINEMMDDRQLEENKRKQLQQELYQKEKMATLGNLVAGAAHEINTPISIIKSRVQIWERKFYRLPEQQKANSVITPESLQIVQNEVSRVSQLIKRLLLMTKPVGKLYKPVYINSMLEDKLNWLQQSYPSRNISVNTNFDTNLPEIEIDPNAIDQVLINILKNAVEASEQDCRLDISTHSDTGYITIEICDYGKGIPSAVETQVFDPFFTTKDEGTGLGLSISYEIIKAHGGSLELRSFGTSDHDSDNGMSKYDLIGSVDAYQQKSSTNSYSEPESGDDTETTVTRSSGTLCIIRLPINSTGN